jgi:hypothetical protein
MMFFGKGMNWAVYLDKRIISIYAFGDRTRMQRGGGSLRRRCMRRIQQSYHQRRLCESRTE